MWTYTSPTPLFQYNNHSHSSFPIPQTLRIFAPIWTNPQFFLKVRGKTEFNRIEFPSRIAGSHRKRRNERRRENNTNRIKTLEFSLPEFRVHSGRRRLLISYSSGGIPCRSPSELIRGTCDPSSESWIYFYPSVKREFRSNINCSCQMAGGTVGNRGICLCFPLIMGVFVGRTLRIKIDVLVLFQLDANGAPNFTHTQIPGVFWPFPFPCDVPFPPQTQKSLSAVR